MISVEEALECILAKVPVLEEEARPLVMSLGQVIAEDVYSEVNVPPADHSIMDGYAVRSGDTLGASADHPPVLRVIGEAAAGRPSVTVVTSGTAVRIMTGALVPMGADAIVPLEDTDEYVAGVKNQNRERKSVTILREAASGNYIRRAGDDIARGVLAVRRGTVIRPGEVGVLASLGRSTVLVHRRPVVAILATGDELVEPGGPLHEGQIYCSNCYSLAAQTLRCGGIPKIIGIARDRPDDLAAKVEAGLAADMLITAGGVSTGDYDFMQDVMAANGEINFRTVRMKPGKPLVFGTFRTGAARQRLVPHLGLPGNPAGCMVAFEEFARPAIMKMLGYQDLGRTAVDAIAESEIQNRGDYRFYGPARVERRDGTYYARLIESQRFGVLTSLAMANGLIVVPEGVARIMAGEKVRIRLLDALNQL